MVNEKGEMKGSAITGPVGKEVNPKTNICVSMKNSFFKKNCFFVPFF